MIYERPIYFKKGLNYLGREKQTDAPDPDVVHPDTAAVCLNNGFGEVTAKDRRLLSFGLLYPSDRNGRIRRGCRRDRFPALIADTDDNLFSRIWPLMRIRHPGHI